MDISSTSSEDESEKEVSVSSTSSLTSSSEEVEQRRRRKSEFDYPERVGGEVGRVRGGEKGPRLSPVSLGPRLSPVGGRREPGTEATERVGMGSAKYRHNDGSFRIMH